MKLHTTLFLAALFVSGSAHAQRYACSASVGTNCNTVLARAGSLTSTLLVQPGACAADARIVDVDVNVRLVHTAVGDLTMALVHPNGTRVEFLYRPGLTPTDGGCVFDDLDATWSDESATQLPACALTIPAVSGVLKPFNSLSAFDGLARNGVWQLVVTDTSSSNDGALLDWSLELPCALPPPAVVSVATGTRDAVEGSTTPATLVFTREGATDAAVTATYAVSGTATPGIDYAPLMGSAVFAPGEATVTVSLLALADGLPETTESAVVTILATENAVPGASAIAGVNLVDVTCGDGFKTGAEACDDGNLKDGDGCSASCEVQAIVVPEPEPTPEPEPQPTKPCGCTSFEAGLVGALGAVSMLRRRRR